ERGVGSCGVEEASELLQRAEASLKSLGVDDAARERLAAELHLLFVALAHRELPPRELLCDRQVERVRAQIQRCYLRKHRPLGLARSLGPICGLPEERA